MLPFQISASSEPVGSQVSHAMCREMSSLDSNNTLQTRRQSRANLKLVNRELIKQVKNHFYGQAASAESQAWTNKVLADLFKVVIERNPKTAEQGGTLSNESVRFPAYVTVSL